MILRQFALSLAALLAISPDAFGQDRAANDALADNQLVFNNVCRTCHTLTIALGQTYTTSSAARRDQFQAMAIQVL